MSSASILTDSSSEPPRPLPREFGRYKLFDYIGKGGMAEIYLARAETGLGAARLCVVKQIVAQFAEHPEFAEMLIHEAKLAANLNHANIVQVFDLGRESGHLFIAMDYVEGMDLNALLRRCSQTKTPLPVGFALKIVSDVLKGLDYAHRARDDAGHPLGIVHRDVSPSNVLISLEGEVKLCDFGIAHANDLVAAKGPQVDEAIRGKAGYMSPEHAHGQAIDARADVFAAGILLWELIAGRRLYKNEPGGPSLLEQARAAKVPPLPGRGLQDEARLHAIVSRALAREPSERFPSAGAMERDIEEYMIVAKLSASSLKLGDWIVDRFGSATINQRRAREQIVSDRPPPSQPKPAPVPISVVPQAPLPRVPPPPAVPAFPAHPVPIPPPSEPGKPGSVVAGTIDLGPPSSTAVDEFPPSRRAGRIVAALAITAIVAGAIAWFALGR